MGPQCRIIDEALDVHFVTFSVDRRRRLLDHDHPRRIVLGVLTTKVTGRRRSNFDFRTRAARGSG